MVDMLNRTSERNPNLIRHSVDLHQAGDIPPDTFVIDLDSVESNAKKMVEEAKKIGINLYYITKQIGRNPIVAKTIVKSGIKKAVVIDIDECRIMHNYGFPIGHVGHLVQVPNRDLKFVIDEVRPDFMTVYDLHKADEISNKAKEIGVKQNIILKIHNPGEFSYPEQISAGGFSNQSLQKVVNHIRKRQNIEINGVTCFPSFRVDISKREEVPTPNVKSLLSAARILQKMGIDIRQINIPADNSSITFPLSKAVAEEFGEFVCVEPGHGLTGSTPLHMLKHDLPEVPSIVYISEISHSSGDTYYAYGGGMMGADPAIGVWSTDYQFFMHALIGNKGRNIFENQAIVRPVGFIDYYIPIRVALSQTANVGDTVVFGFRPQIFVTRSHVAVVKGINKNKPKLIGLFDSRGNLLDNKTLRCKSTVETKEFVDSF